MSESWGYDPSSGLHLPPSSRPSTPQASRQEMVAAIKMELRQLVVDATHDQADHALAVAGGPVLWRQVFQKEFGALWTGNRAQADNVADALYRVIVGLWDKRYPGVKAKAFLDAVHIPSPLSEKEWNKEVDDAWELEIGGSEEGLRFNYEGSARVRKGADLGNKYRR